MRPKDALRLGFLKLLQAVFVNHMSASHHHWRICLSSLFFGDWTCEDRVIPIFRRKRDFNLPRCSNIPSPRLKRKLTGSSLVWLHSLFFSIINLRPFSILLMAPPPPMSPTIRKGKCLLNPRQAQYSFANACRRSECNVGFAKSAYGEESNLWWKIIEVISRCISCECVS